MRSKSYWGNCTNFSENNWKNYIFENQVSKKCEQISKYMYPNIWTRWFWFQKMHIQKLFWIKICVLFQNLLFPTSQMMFLLKFQNLCNLMFTPPLVNTKLTKIRRHTVELTYQLGTARIFLLILELLNGNIYKSRYNFPFFSLYDDGTTYKF